MLSWSLAQCGLTRSHGVSQRCFISVAVLKWQSDPGSQAGLGFRPEVSWRIWRIAPQMLMHFPCLRPHSSPVLLFPLYPGDYPWFASVCAKLTLGIFNSIYYDHICWSFFCCRFLSIWCPHSSPAVIDCAYPGLFTVTVPNAHTSSGLLGFYVSKRHFCVRPLLYKLKSK